MSKLENKVVGYVIIGFGNIGQVLTKGVYPQRHRSIRCNYT